MSDDVPSILTQAVAGGFAASFYDFRKAKMDGIDFFNPAIVRKSDGLWLITRRSEFMPTFEFGQNDLMAFKLDEDHLPLFGQPVVSPRSSNREHFEDPRIFRHAGRWWLSACNFVVYSPGSWTGAHQVVLEIDKDWHATRRRDPIFGKNGSSVFDQRGDEKNWLWFSHENELHLIYMTVPHRVVRFDREFRAVQEWRTQHWLPEWKHGQPRGGTAPILVKWGKADSSLSEYLSFFHSSTPWRTPKRRYHMGAYTFQAEPPFQVTGVTPEPLLSGSLEDPWGKDKPLVIFPCAALHENGAWTISAGVNDLVSARVTILDSILASRISREVKKIAVETDLLSPQEIIYG